MTLTSKGSCLCGSIQVSISGEPIKRFVCYCSDCRKGSGHLGQFIVMLDTKDIEISDSNSRLKEYTVTSTKSGFPKRKQFCCECGCTILTLPMKFKGEKAMFRPSLLDEKFSHYSPTQMVFEEAKTNYVEGIENEFY